MIEAVIFDVDGTLVDSVDFHALAACKINVASIGMLCGGFNAGVLRDAGVSKLYKDPADLLERYEQSPICA